MKSIWNQSTGWQGGDGRPFGFQGTQFEDNSFEIIVSAETESGKKEVSLILSPKQLSALYTMLTTMRTRSNELDGS